MTQDEKTQADIDAAQKQLEFAKTQHEAAAQKVADLTGQPAQAAPAATVAAQAQVKTLADLAANHADKLFNRLNASYGPIPDRYYSNGKCDAVTFATELAGREATKEKQHAWMNNFIESVYEGEK